MWPHLAWPGTGLSLKADVGAGWSCGPEAFGMLRFGKIGAKSLSGQLLGVRLASRTWWFANEVIGVGDEQHDAAEGMHS